MYGIETFGMGLRLYSFIYPLILLLFYRFINIDLPIGRHNDAFIPTIEVITVCNLGGGVACHLYKYM